MKTLGKKLLVLLLTICMVTPLLSQPALAADGLEAEDPGSIVVVSGLDTESVTMKPIGADEAQPDLFDADVPTPYALTEGNRVLSIRAYPLAKDPDGDTIIYYNNIYAGYNYSTSYPALAGFALSHNQTISLMRQMLETLAVSDKYQNYKLVGWHIEADIWFYYSKPDYMIYRYKTSTAVSDDIKENINNTNYIHKFAGNFGYPTQYNTDPLNDHYFLGFTGEVYSTNTYGNFIGRSFTATVSFNSPNPTTPD